jgi:LPS O-antigen subunit length determinant protein (WzzB/FepE family)
VAVSKEKFMTEANRVDEIYDDEINLSSIFFVLWEKRKLIIFGTLGATLLSIVISFLISKTYRSEGYYQLGNPLFRMEEKVRRPLFRMEEKDNQFNTDKQKSIGISIPIYKSSSSQFFNPNNLLEKANHEKFFNEENLKKMTYDLKSSGDISKWIKPVYAFAKEDAREFSQLPKDEGNAVLGMNIAYETDSPESAAAHVSFFGKYIRDCLLYVTVYNYVTDGYSKSVAALNKNENETIRFQFDLVQNTNKMKDIQAILSNYPEAAKMESRQLVSVQEGGDRFLAPVTQLVGIESTLADIRRELASLKRDRENLSIRVEYFSRAFNKLGEIKEHGDSLIQLLKTIKDDIFKNKDLNRDEIKEVFNTLLIDLQVFEFTFYQNSRFVSAPTIPTTHIKPNRSIIAAVTFITSFLFFVILAFVTHWWHLNKKNIV